MAKYTFTTQADKDAAIAVQVASTSEVKAVHDKHLADLKSAEVTG